MSAAIGIAADIDANAAGVIARLVPVRARAVKRVPPKVLAKVIANAMAIGIRSGIAVVRTDAAAKPAVPRAGVARVVHAKAARERARETASATAIGIAHAARATAIETRKETRSGKAKEMAIEIVSAIAIGSPVAMATARLPEMAVATAK